MTLVLVSSTVCWSNRPNLFESFGLQSLDRLGSHSPGDDRECIRVVMHMHAYIDNECDAVMTKKKYLSVSRVVSATTLEQLINVAKVVQQTVSER